jgi:hypothetical protein
MHDRQRIVNDSILSNDVHYAMPPSGACVVDHRFPKRTLGRGSGNITSRVTSLLLYEKHSTHASHRNTVHHYSPRAGLRTRKHH